MARAALQNPDLPEDSHCEASRHVGGLVVTPGARAHPL